MLEAGNSLAAWELARSSSIFASRVSGLNNIYAVPRQIKPGILNLTIRRNQSNLALSLFLLAQRKRLLSQGTRSKFSSEGAKEELVDEIWDVACLGIFI